MAANFPLPPQLQTVSTVRSADSHRRAARLAHVPPARDTRRQRMVAYIGSAEAHSSERPDRMRKLYFYAVSPRPKYAVLPLAAPIHSGGHSELHAVVQVSVEGY